MPYLSVVIPAYNESERLPETLVLLQHYLDEQDYESEVIVVDDGSTDGTAALVRKTAREFPQLRLVANKQNKGKGGVVKQGMLAATGEYRLFMDADYSTPIPEVEKLLASVDKYEVIIGSRYLDKKSIKVRQPFKRRLISRTCNLLIQAMVLPGVKDTQCGFKLFSAEAAERIFPKLKMTGWSFDIEVLAIARQLGYRINEVPVNWFDAKFSRLNASRAAAASFIGDLMTITQRFRRQAYR